MFPEIENVPQTAFAVFAAFRDSAQLIAKPTDQLTDMDSVWSEAGTLLLPPFVTNEKETI